MLAWRCVGDNSCLNQRWPRSLTHICVLQSQMCYIMHYVKWPVRNHNKTRQIAKFAHNQWVVFNTNIYISIILKILWKKSVETFSSNVAKRYISITYRHAKLSWKNTGSRYWPGTWILAYRLLGTNSSTKGQNHTVMYCNVPLSKLQVEPSSLCNPLRTGDVYMSTLAPKSGI